MVQITLSKNRKWVKDLQDDAKCYMLVKTTIADAFAVMHKTQSEEADAVLRALVGYNTLVDAIFMGDKG